MDRLLSAIDRLSGFGAVLAAAALVALSLIGAAEIVLRGFFSTSLTFIVEVNGYLLAIAFLGGAADAMREGGHIRVSLLPGILPPAARRALDLAATAIGLLLATYLAYAVALLAWGSFRYGTTSFFPSRTPLVYPQAAMALMLVLFALALLARLLRLVTGRPAEPRAAGQEGPEPS